jgi:hypothetical protein
MPGSPADTSSALDAARLEAIAGLLLASTDPAPGDPPRLVRVRVGVDGLAPDELEIGTAPLPDGDHPLDSLVGLVAPADWQALGVVATGRASTLGDGPAARRPVPVATAHLVARDGTWASVWEPMGGGAGPRGADRGDAEGGLACTGRVDDAMRRALGVPTGPPPASTLGLLATQWLDAVVAVAAADPRRPPGLRQVLAHHPAVAAFDLDPDQLALHQLVADAQRLAGLRTWADLRRSCAKGTWPEPAVDRGLAAWFDDGSFARWVLGGWPDLADLVDAVADLLPAGAAAAVAVALDAWGLAR